MGDHQMKNEGACSPILLRCQQLEVSGPGTLRARNTQCVC